MALPSHGASCANSRAFHDICEWRAHQRPPAPFLCAPRYAIISRRGPTEPHARGSLPRRAQSGTAGRR
eukprot:7386963-Prymnesium_polylepis.1